MEFDPDVYEASVVGCTVDFSVGEQSVPMHQHQRGQLLTTWKGLVRCELMDGLWPVPPDCALWIPGNRLHRSIVSTEGKICLLYFDQQSDVLPNTSCFVTLTPLVREMIWHMASVEPRYEPTGPDGRIATALVGQLAHMDVEQLSVPMPNNPRLRRIAECLIKDPGNRRTVAEWADIVATSEKTLGRLLRSETGMSFVQWRQQLQLVVAIRKLRTGSTVQQVADALGYESTNAFGSMFKKIMGKPPGYYAAPRRQDGATRARRWLANE